ncbi:MAG: hypothetical protein ACR2N7_12815 [Acidimicrobiia bacterium]
MASVEKLVRMSVEATGDDEIFVAGDFEPKGMMWKQMAGAAVGSAVGGAVTDGNSWAQAAGASGGIALGSLAAGASTHLPPVVILAATPTKLYVLATPVGRGHIFARNLEALSVFERDNLTITLKKRMATRTAVIEDESTGETIKLEGVKIGFHHMNDLLNAIDQEEHDAAEAESAARIAAGEAEEARLAAEGA